MIGGTIINGIEGDGSFPFVVAGDETLSLPPPVFQQGLPTRGEDICVPPGRRSYSASASRNVYSAKRRHTC